MTTKYIRQDFLDCILMALMPANRLACKLSLATGLRISDVLNLRSEDLHRERISIRERKTGKRRRFTIPAKLRDELMAQAGKIYIFENRLDYRKPRTRSAVYKDVRRVAEALRLGRGIAPHSMRKCYAVGKYHATGDIKRVQKLLNHDHEAVTMLYCFADQLRTRSRGEAAKPAPAGA